MNVIEEPPRPKYGELVYNAFWFSPEREALQAIVTETQRDVAGLVRLKLYKGDIIVAGRKSPKSLYDPTIATMERNASTYDQSDATGFIRLNALRTRLACWFRRRAETGFCPALIVSSTNHARLGPNVRRGRICEASPFRIGD